MYCQLKKFASVAADRMLTATKKSISSKSVNHWSKGVLCTIFQILRQQRNLFQVKNSAFTAESNTQPLSIQIVSVFHLLSGHQIDHNAV